MKNSKNKYAKIMAVLVIATAFFVLGSVIERLYFRQYIQEKTEEIINIQNDGYTKVSVGINSADLSFSADCYRLTMTITNDQAFSISRGMQKVFERPMTHDLIKDIFDGFGINAIEARIEKYYEGLYYAKIYLQKGNRVLSIDSRPSDISGIAVRTGIPVYVKTDILTKNGTYTC